MGTAERKARQKEELKELILQAAKKLFLEKGIENTTIRSIAQATEYSVGTVYLYYKDKNEILHDLHQKGFTQLGGEMKSLFDIEDPHKRLFELGKTYIRFAMENPEMYDLMFNVKAPMDFIKEKEQETWNEGKATFNVLRSTVKQCMDKGYFRKHQPEPLSFAIWSSVHGMCSLMIRERIKGATDQEPQQLVKDAYADFMKLLE
jgi:AcrR family transcriptional regulator